MVRTAIQTGQTGLVVGEVAVFDSGEDLILSALQDDLATHITGVFLSGDTDLVLEHEDGGGITNLQVVNVGIVHGIFSLEVQRGSCPSRLTLTHTHATPSFLKNHASNS